MLADSQAELLAAWALVRETAKMYDEKHTPGKKNPEISLRASCAKMYATEMLGRVADRGVQIHGDRKSTRLNSSHVAISYAVFCLKKKNQSRKVAEMDKVLTNTFFRVII